MKLFIIILFSISVIHYAQVIQSEAPKSDVFLQGFYWNSPPGGNWYDSLSRLAPRLASAGFSAVWLPSPVKGAGGGFSMGYDPYDHYDFGDYNQKGSKETRFGSKQELVSLITQFHQLGIQVFADAVLRHMMGGEVKVPYECRPIWNGNYIVPDSAYLLFNYPLGSGRFKKNASSFYPNSVNCWVDPLFVQTDPIFRFGEWLDHNKPAIRDSLIVWGNYLRNVLKYDGFRLDAVKSISPQFMAQWLNSCNQNGYAVAELWGSMSEIGDWLYQCKYVHGANVSMFDFPLRYTLKDMCNNTTGSFDMTWLDGAGLVNNGFSGYDVSTFVENHDFDRIGWDGSVDTGHDPIISDKHLAYAYIIFSEGRPSVFFKDYVDYGYGGKIDTLIWIRRVFLGGGTTKRNGLNPYYIRQDNNQDQNLLQKDIYVARRNGFGSQIGGYIVINDNPTQWIDVWVDTELPIGTYYKDYTGKDVNKEVMPPIPGGNKNRVKLWAPPRSYTIYAADTIQTLNNPPVIQKISDQIAYTNSFFQLKVNAIDVNNDPLTFTAIGRPNWLSLTADGIFHGTPSFSDTGLSVIILTVSDNKGGIEKDTFNLSVLKNFPPSIQAINDTTIKATQRYQYQAIATDPDNDSLYFFFSISPSWLTLENSTGILAGTPALEDTGYHSVHLLVTDSKGAFDSTVFTIRVTENVDSVIYTYGKPLIDGTINIGFDDWRPEWQITVDPDSDSYWRPLNILDNELLGMFVTWDADSLYIGVDYVINDNFNTLMLYINAGLAGGVTNFNSTQGYLGDYPKNFRFRPHNAIDYFIAAYYHDNPALYKITNNTSELMTNKFNGRRGPAGRGAELAVSWNDIYGLGPGLVPANVQLEFVSLVAGGMNWGAGDSSPDNPDVDGNQGPDSLIFLAIVFPDENGDGIPDPTIILSSKDENNNILPNEFFLFQNYPNPFNPVTTIKFSIPKFVIETCHGMSLQSGMSQQSLHYEVSLRIYDVLGREIISLINEQKSPGNYEIKWDASGLPSGIYFYRLAAGEYNVTKKMILLK